MMNDDFIRELRGDWQSQALDVTSALQRVRRARWKPHLALALEMSACVFAGAVGLWFAWVAFHNEQHRILFALSAAIMLTTAPAFGVANLMARFGSLAWDAESAESLLRVGVRRADASLRAVRLGHWHFWIVAVFVAVLWIAQAFGFIRAIGFLIFYTTVCLVVCAGSGLWMKRRAKQLRNERVAYLAVLAKLQVDAEGSGN